MPFSRDNSNYINCNKKLIVSSLPSASFLQVQAPNKQTAFKVNRDSLQGWGNVSAQAGSNDPSASCSIQSLTFIVTQNRWQITSNLNSAAVYSSHLIPTPLPTFPNTIFFQYIPPLLITPWSTQSLCVFILLTKISDCAGLSPNICPDARE